MKLQNLERKRTARNLVIFTVVVLASGWLGYGLDRLMNNPPEQQLGLLLWLITPLITVLLLRAFAGDGWKDFGLRPALKRNAIWYVASLLIYPLVAVLVLAIGGILGLVTAPNFSLNLLLSVFAGGLIASFIKNIFEEFAWRGYLAPKVYSLGLNAYVGHAIVGLGELAHSLLAVFVGSDVDPSHDNTKHGNVHSAGNSQFGRGFNGLWRNPLVDQFSLAATAVAHCRQCLG